MFDGNHGKKLTLANKLEFGAYQNHGKNALESVQTCFYVLQLCLTYPSLI